MLFKAICLPESYPIAERLIELKDSLKKGQFGNISEFWERWTKVVEDSLEDESDLTVSSSVIILHF